ncbi:LOW QUALITY PROTEIN: hypothetical protein YC2023_063566 [Brassica napus]
MGEQQTDGEVGRNKRELKVFQGLRTAENNNTNKGANENNKRGGGWGVLGFGGSNPLEQLGLFMKHEDDDEEETEPMVALPDHLGINEEVEEGEID